MTAAAGPWAWLSCPPTRPGGANTIQFDSTVFGGPQTIELTQG